MSAAQYGASLLADVREERLDQLLVDLQCAFDSSSRYSVGLPEIDALLDISQTSTAQPLFYPATGTQQLTNDVYLDEELQPGHDIEHVVRGRGQPVSKTTTSMIELSSYASHAGKSSLLYLLAAVSILPIEHNGKASAVVWLDADTRFSATYLYQVCYKRLRRYSPDADMSTLRSMSREALKHVHVFPIQSSRHLTRTLDVLPSYLLQRDPGDQDSKSNSLPQHHSLHRPLSLLVLDSAQAFYWPDRFGTEIARLESIGTTTSIATDSTTTITTTSPSPPTTTQILNQLRSIQSRFTCSIIYTTNHSLTQPQTQPQQRPTDTVMSTVNPQTPNRPNLQSQSSSSLSPFTTSATLSLTLSRVAVPQFASHMTVKECRRDQERRMEVVRRGRVRVAVNEIWLDRVVRDRNVRDRILAMDGKGGFVIRDDEDGVYVEE